MYRAPKRRRENAADFSKAIPEKSLQEYANERLNDATDFKYEYRKADVDLTQPGYILSGKHGNWSDRSLQVFNITDEALTVIVVPLSYGRDTVASTFAKRTPPDSAVMRLAMAVAVRRDSPVLYTVDMRSDFTFSVASEMLLILAKADGRTARVLDARYVGGNESVALAVLPKMLEESGEPFAVQSDKLTESIVEEVLDQMGGTKVPHIEVRVKVAGCMESTSDPGLRIDILDDPISNTIARLRLQVGHFVNDIQDMYVWHNERLLEDEVTLSELSVEKNGDLQTEVHAAAKATVVSVYLLPGRKQGRLEHLANSAKSGVDNAVTETLLPLAERDFSEKDVNDFDVQTFSLYSSKIVFVNRTSARVHLSCFPTWSRRRNMKSVEVSAENGVVKAGVTVEVETTIQHHQGYGAVQDPCLEGIGAFDIVNIPKGMAREMSVVVGVESADRQSIGYKQLKNVRGGQQLDVLKSFLTKGSKYTHPVGQPSKDELAANFLPRR